MRKKIQIAIEDSADSPAKEELPPAAPEEEKCSIQVEGKEFGTDLSYRLIEKFDLMKKIEEGIPMATYLKDYPKRDVAAEFQLLKKITETKHHSGNLHPLDKSYNKCNRYSNIIPFIHSEVKISTVSEDPHDSYINANYVNSSLGNDKLFICTQGPLQSTRGQFWRMIWQENARLVIMLSQVVEEGRVKCDQYWPREEGETLELEGIRVMNKTVVSGSTPGLVASILEIQDTSTNESREIQHVRCEFWPDHGIPEKSDQAAIMTLCNTMLEEAGKRNEGDDGKIVVHCSAGIGRTGTIVAIFNIMSAVERLIEEEKKGGSQVPRLSVFGTVRRLREQRYCMVQTLEQYQYIYDFMGDWIQSTQGSCY